MVSPRRTENGVGIYDRDRTGPACAIACGAGKYNYFVPVNGEISLD